MGFERYALFNLNKLVRCPTCKNDTFYKRKILLNTRGMTFFDMDFFNKNATVLKCQKCGRYQWFDKNIGKLAKYSKVKKTKTISSKRKNGTIRSKKKKRTRRRKR